MKLKSFFQLKFILFQIMKALFNDLSFFGIENIKC